MKDVRDKYTGDFHFAVIDYALVHDMTAIEVDAMLDSLSVAAESMRRMTRAECREHDACIALRIASGRVRSCSKPSSNYLIRPYNGHL